MKCMIEAITQEGKVVIYAGDCLARFEDESLLVALPSALTWYPRELFVEVWDEFDLVLQGVHGKGVFDKGYVLVDQIRMGFAQIDVFDYMVEGVVQELLEGYRTPTRPEDVRYLGLKGEL